MFPLSSCFPSTKTNLSLLETCLCHSFQKYLDQSLSEAAKKLQKLGESIPCSDDHFLMNGKALSEKFKQKMIGEEMTDFDACCASCRIEGNCQGQTIAFLQNCSRSEFMAFFTNINDKFLGVADLKKWLDPHTAAYSQYCSRNRGDAMENDLKQAIAENVSIREKHSLILSIIDFDSDEFDPLEDLSEEQLKQFMSLLIDALSLDVQEESDDKQFFADIVDLYKIKEFGNILNLRFTSRLCAKRNGSMLDVLPLESCFDQGDAFYIQLSNHSNISISGHMLGILRIAEQWLVYDSYYGLFSVKDPKAILKYVQSFIEYVWWDENLDYDRIDLVSYSSL